MLATFIGTWWAFVPLFVLECFFFGYLLPVMKKPIFAHAPANLPRKVLDEYIWTWNAKIARRFLEDIGSEGRAALQGYYWKIDFWFPVLTASLANVSLLMLALDPASNVAWLSWFAMLGWVFDLLENVNHYNMSRDYPNLSTYSLRIGPIFTCIKWIAAVVPIVVAIILFILRATGLVSL